MEALRSIWNRLLGAGRYLVSLYSPNTLRERGWIWGSGLLLVTLLLALLAIGAYWSRTPEPFDVVAHANALASAQGRKVVSGYTTAATLVGVAGTLLDKSGGYLTNDMLPPGRLLDNMPNWEFGVLVQVRDLARVLRNDFSRSQSQSVEDKDLAIAEPQFKFDSESWIFPASESEYRKGLEALQRYLDRLNDQNEQDAQFYTRADNLTDWLAVVEKRLGSLSQRLSASVEQVRVNTDLAGDASAETATFRPGQIVVKTPWLQIDDVFWEARGATWALLEFLRAVEVDFKGVLQKKNALVSLQQIIRELEMSQQSITSPVILNGRGFGIFANYSLVMASYISRANAAVIDLRNLLQQG